MIKRSFFQEHLEVALHGIQNIDKVVESRFNSAKDFFNKLEPDKKEESERRLEICLTCPFNSVNAKSSLEYKNLMGKSYETTRSNHDLHCSFCGCPIDKKVLAMTDMCGVYYFNVENPAKALPLKWERYP